MASWRCCEFRSRCNLISSRREVDVRLAACTAGLADPAHASDFLVLTAASLRVVANWPTTNLIESAKAGCPLSTVVVAPLL
jgi:hypothetical protein